MSVILAVCMTAPFSAVAAENSISTQNQLSNAFSNGGNYILAAGSIGVRDLSITKDVTINGANNELRSSGVGTQSMFYQNENVNSVFTDVNITGNSKKEIGIWLGGGSMTFNGCNITGFNISTERVSALGIAGTSHLVLNNTSLDGNSQYDLYIRDKASVDICGTSTVGKIRVDSNFAKINIGSDWEGNIELTFDYPIAKAIGTVAGSADISGISVTNSGYYVACENGKLILKTDSESAVHFDMSKRSKLYKGSTGFLYGEAEINVPSIDLLYGLKPDTMVQKAYGGKQHPTGDAVRTGSALLSAGVRDMQIYLQDNYLEWPYDAPIKDGQIDLDAYQKTVEGIIYGMICDEASESDSGAFRGSDGKYYILNNSKDNYSYVLFNEPDQIWYGGNLEGLENAWLRIYNAVHSIDPDARCVGPNFSGFNEDSYNRFLGFCYDNNCLPEIISWHELGDISLTDYYVHYDAVQSMVAKYYTESYAQKSGRDYQPQLMVNEYARHYDIGAPGGLVKWLAMFEDKDMSGCMAYWAMANTLNEMAADQNSPTSTWWVYHWYAQMTGEQCELTSPDFADTRFYGLTSYDSNITTAYALFGGNENQNGSEAVYLDNIDSTDLVNSDSTVNVKLYAVSFSGQLGANYKPQVIFDGAAKADGGTLKISVSNTDEMDAYFAVITKTDKTANEGVAATMQTLNYEAEAAQLLGGATVYDKDGWATFATSGRADVGNINNNGDGVCFNVNVPESGYYNAQLFYSLQAPYVNPQTLKPDASGQNRGIGKALPYGMDVDGKALDNIVLESTVTWWYKNHCDTVIYLTEGKHKIAYKHINGNEGSKGNLQLVAALDKLDLTEVDGDENKVEICLDELTNFKEDGGYRVTVVAPQQGYYNVTANGSFALKKQCIDYAADAKSKSVCSVYDTDTGNTVYLAQGANTFVVSGSATKLTFDYDSNKTESTSEVIASDKLTLHGNNPYLKGNSYAQSGKVVSEIGIGQTSDSEDRGEYNYAKFTVSADADGVYNIAVRYANDEPAPIMERADGSTYIHPYNIDLVERYAQISVNGGEPETVYFKNTLSWETFRTVNVQVQLSEGDNEIKIYNDNSYQFSNLVNSTAPEIDNVTVSPLTYGSKAEYKAGEKSEQHHFEGSTQVTKATTSKNGKSVSDLTCTECGYHCVKTQTIAKIAGVTLSTNSYTYNGKAKKPAVTVKDSGGKVIGSENYTISYTANKNVGTAKVTVTFKGNYSGTVTKSFKINPQGTAVTKLTAGKKQLTAQWKKQTAQTTGYQIQYSTAANFKGAKTVTIVKNKTVKTTVKKLTSKKKYYVRIRTYKTAGKTKYYSAWSKAKSIKIK